jgi:FKBP-type peptidyl-prolyl cis-trans isomerase FklB
MKNIFLIGMIFFGFSIGLIAQNSKQMDSLSYSVGVLVGENLKRQGLSDVKTDDLAMGLSDILNGKDLNISLEEANSVLEKYMQAQNEQAKSKNVDAGKRFLEENAKRSGVVVLPSGLQYEIMKEGSGPKPKATDKVTTHYHGTLIDGTVFDSSVERGEPATFPVNGVIKGWVEALQLMPVGSKWKLFIPHDLAYGDRGAGAAIQPFSTLVFEVELLEIK